MAGADAAQQVLAKQLSADIGQKQIDARTLQEKSPKEALAMLQQAKTDVEKSNLPEAMRLQLSRRVDRSILDTEKYILDNKAQIELDEANAAVIAEVERTRAMRLKMQDSIAGLVDQFNKKFYEEHAYAEAEAHRQAAARNRAQRTGRPTGVAEREVPAPGNGDATTFVRRKKTHSTKWPKISIGRASIRLRAETPLQSMPSVGRTSAVAKALRR